MATTFKELYRELGGVVPKIPRQLCKTLINRAWGNFRRQNLWSWLLFDANWFSPSPVNSGTVTTVQGQNTVTFDATATAAINAIGLLPSPVTARQFRIGVNPIYNIWQWDAVAGVATLDRLYSEVSGAGASFNIFQSYFPAPFQDFKRFETVKDMVNNFCLDCTKDRAWVDQRDAQRQWGWGWPTHVVPYGTDKNPASPTLGWPLFELWGQPQSNLPYALYGERKGTDLVDDSDELPNGIGSDVIIAKAKPYAYEWAESNPSSDPKVRAPNYSALAAGANAEYLRLYREYRKEDREFVDNWFVNRVPAQGTGRMVPFYNAVTGMANPGR